MGSLPARVACALVLSACSASHPQADTPDASLDAGLGGPVLDAGSWPAVCSQPGFFCVSCSGMLTGSLACDAEGSSSTDEVSAVEASNHPDPVPVGASDVFVIAGCDLQVTNEGNATWNITNPSCPAWTMPNRVEVENFQITAGTVGYDGLKRSFSISGTAVMPSDGGAMIGCSVLEQGDLFCL